VTPWYQSRKLWIAIAGIAAITAVVLGGQALGVEDRAGAIEAIKWVVVTLIGGHALTDAAAQRPSGATTEGDE